MILYLVLFIFLSLTDLKSVDKESHADITLLKHHFKAYNSLQEIYFSLLVAITTYK